MTRDLDAFFRPASVAVVGAGERPTSSGGAVCQNLAISGYRGRVVPVTPRGGTVFGHAAVTSLRELAEPVDLVVVVIRPDAIPEVLREAAETGHRNVLILPGGFAEGGAEAQRRDAWVREFAAGAGLTIAGPNCAGLVHLAPDSRFAATFLRAMPPGGPLAFVSQSGALAEEVIAHANGHAVPFGTVVSVGNAMHLGVTEHLAHLGADDGIAAVFLYVEHVDDPDRFAAVCRDVVRRKPVVALVGGATAVGGRAAAAHTGARAMDDAGIDALLARAGAIRATSLRRLLLAAKGFGFFPGGIGARVLVLSNSGGPGVLAADRAALEGLELPALPPAMATAMRAAFPPECTIANPVDLLADAREDRFGATLDLAVAAGTAAFDAVLMIHVVPFMVEAAPVVERLAATAAAAPFPVMHAMMGTLPERAAWFARMEAAGVPAFDDVEAMAECAGLLARHRTLAV
jgi:acyl-CoA synthetase (NDP forming)